VPLSRGQGKRRWKGWKSKSPSGKGGSKHKKDVGDPTDEKARSCRRRAESFQKLSAEGKQGIAGHAYDPSQ